MKPIFFKIPDWDCSKSWFTKIEDLGQKSKPANLFLMIPRTYPEILRDDSIKNKNKNVEDRFWNFKNVHFWEIAFKFVRVL